MMNGTDLSQCNKVLEEVLEELENHPDHNQLMNSLHPFTRSKLNRLLICCGKIYKRGKEIREIGKKLDNYGEIKK